MSEPSKEQKMYACRMVLANLGSAVNAYRDFLTRPHKDPIAPLKRERVEALVWVCEWQGEQVRSMMRTIS